MKGKYIGFASLKTYSATGVNINKNGNRIVLNFFNESPSPSDEFEVEVHDNKIVSTTDTTSEYVMLRKFVSSVEFDANSLRRLLQFIMDNIDETEEKHE